MFKEARWMSNLGVWMRSNLLTQCLAGFCCRLEIAGPRGHCVWSTRGPQQCCLSLGVPGTGTSVSCCWRNVLCRSGHTHTHTHTRTHAHGHTRARANTHTRTHARARGNTYTHTHTHTHGQRERHTRATIMRTRDQRSAFCSQYK